MNVKEGKTNPDLFRLLLQEDVKKYLISTIQIPEKERSRGYNKIKIDFYVGSTGNILLDKVDILCYNNISNGCMFWVDKDGNYRNNSLSDEDFNRVIELTSIMKYDEGLDDYYDLFSIPETLTLEERIAKALKEEDYELLSKLKRES